MIGVIRSAGYTIIEVMIVLAVSGAIFFVAYGSISGKQASTAFTIGTNEFATQLRTIIVQIQNGQYTDVTIGCDSSGTNIVFNSPTAKHNCVVIGKFLHFSLNGDNTKYEIFSLVGSSGASTLATARVTPVTNAIKPSNPELTTQETIPQNLKVTSIKNSNGAAYWGIGFFQSLSDSDANGSAQPVYLSSATAIGSSMSESDVAGYLNSTSLVQINSAIICLTDGSRYATVLLGDATSAGQMNVNLKIVATPC
jgi:prepilin-type N-terminal cleavage/methylation domain-containing protein